MFPDPPTVLFVARVTDESDAVAVPPVPPPPVTETLVPPAVNPLPAAVRVNPVRPLSMTTGLAPVFTSAPAPPTPAPLRVIASLTGPWPLRSRVAPAATVVPPGATPTR